MKAVIITNGNISKKEIIIDECKTADIIICADGGAKLARQLMIVPDYLIGDFDSIDDDTYHYFLNTQTKIDKYPSEKDYTDTEICIEKALELGCDQICIAAGIGGRLDHSLGNIGLLHIINQKKSFGWIASDDAYIFLCNDSLSIHGEIGDTISLIPFKDDAIGVSLKGFKYSLNDALIKFGRPIGISNELAEESAFIQIKSGELLVIKQKII